MSALRFLASIARGSHNCVPSQPQSLGLLRTAASGLDLNYGNGHWSTGGGAGSCNTRRKYSIYDLGVPHNVSPKWWTAGTHVHINAANSSRVAVWPCTWESRCHFGLKSSADHAGKSETKAAALADADIFGEASNLGLFAKFKLMYKKYWYVLIPVHVVTSIGWLGGFYYLSSSGVDVPALLEHMHLSETIIEKVKHSQMGHIAIAYLCYKVATPLRYALTLGGTTISIKYLVQAGHIKPMPSKEEIFQMYEQKKAHRAAIKADKAEREATAMEKKENK